VRAVERVCGWRGCEVTLAVARNASEAAGDPTHALINTALNLA
jgi:hypothetical protein